MPPSGIGRFAGFDLSDVSPIRLLATGLDYSLGGGKDLESFPSLAKLTKTQESTIMDLPYRMKGSPLLDEILRTFLETPRISKEVMLATGRDLRDYVNYASENPSLDDYQKATADWKNQVPMPLPFNMTAKESEGLDQAAMTAQRLRLARNDNAEVHGAAASAEDSDDSSEDVPVPRKGNKKPRKKSEDSEYSETGNTPTPAAKYVQRKGSRAAGKKKTASKLKKRGNLVDRDTGIHDEEQGTGFGQGEQGSDGDDEEASQENTFIDPTVNSGPSRANPRTQSNNPRTNQPWLESEHSNVVALMRTQLKTKNHVKWIRLTNSYNKKHYNNPQAKGERVLSTSGNSSANPFERLTPWRTSRAIRTRITKWNGWSQFREDMKDFRERNGVSETIESRDYETSGDDEELPESSEKKNRKPTTTAALAITQAPSEKENRLPSHDHHTAERIQVEEDDDAGQSPGLEETTSIRDEVEDFYSAELF